ncbi:MAG: flagellar export protein FliJ [Proteobacteria bacterium]|nr:flagellar export protein FliJ [Pseudomonadota bacterium]
MARKFTFQLESLLEMRKLGEQRVQARLAERMRISEAERVVLAELEATAATYRAELERRQRGVVDIHEVMTYMEYIGALDGRMHAQRARIADADAEVDRVRAELVRATQQKKAVEKLRERQFEDYTKEQQRAETLYLDEMSSTRQRKGGQGVDSPGADGSAP